MNATIPSPRRMRWWMPATIVVLGTIAIIALQVPEEIDNGFRFFFTCFAGAVTGLLLALWYIFFTGLPARTRWPLLGGGIVALVALLFGVKVDGFTGDMRPRLVWAWTPKTDLLLSDRLEAAPVAGGGEVDLATTSATDFSQFLGQNRSGVVQGVHLDPDWAEHPPELMWRQAIGAGWSSFAVVGKFAVTQEQRGDKELVVCYELETGRSRWSHADIVRFSEKMGGDGPRATPTITGGRVYTLGATGLLNCLDGATGKAIWMHDIFKDYPGDNLPWGKSSSPLVYDDHLVVSLGATKGPTVVAYHKDTGAPLWQGGQDQASYSSPVLATLAGTKQILMINAESATGHDPTDGHILWEYDWPGKMAKCSQPLALPGDRVFLPTGYGFPCVLLQIDKVGSQMMAKEIWQNKNLKAKFTAPIVRDGHAYGLDDGILVCVELEKGTRKWKSERYGHGQVLMVGDLLLVQAEKGDVALVEATPVAGRELARFPALSSKTWTIPSLSGPYLLVRNDQEAACYKLPLRKGIGAPNMLGD